MIPTHIKSLDGDKNHTVCSVKLGTYWNNFETCQNDYAALGLLIHPCLTLRSISSSESISMSAEAGSPPALPCSPLLLFVIGEPHPTTRRGTTCEFDTHTPPLIYRMYQTSLHIPNLNHVFFKTLAVEYCLNVLEMEIKINSHTFMWPVTGNKRKGLS